MRAFLCIELFGALRASYEAALPALRRAAPGVRWTRPENLHLTLRFLGETAEDAAAALREELGARLGEVPAFDLEIGRPGAFEGGRAAPRVLWIDVARGAAELGRVAELCEEAAVRRGFAPEPRPFRAHITLGRNPGGAPVRGWEEALGAAGLQGARQRAEEVVLMSSELDRGGPRHAPVWRAPLQ